MGPRIMFLKIKGSFIHRLHPLNVAHLDFKRKINNFFLCHCVLWLHDSDTNKLREFQQMDAQTSDGGDRELHQSIGWFFFPHQYPVGFICHWGNSNHRLCHVLPHRATLLLDPFSQCPPESGLSWPVARPPPILVWPLT